MEIVGRGRGPVRCWGNGNCLSKNIWRYQKRVGKWRTQHHVILFSFASGLPLHYTSCIVINTTPVLLRNSDIPLLSYLTFPSRPLTFLYPGQDKAAPGRQDAALRCWRILNHSRYSCTTIHNPRSRAACEIGRWNTVPRGWISGSSTDTEAEPARDPTRHQSRGR